MDWVDLAVIDLSLFDAPGGKEKLAGQLYDALKNIGIVDEQLAIDKNYYIANFHCYDRLHLRHQLWAHSRGG